MTHEQKLELYNIWAQQSKDVPCLERISLPYALSLWSIFQDDPQGELENEIDSIFTDDAFSNLSGDDIRNFYTAGQLSTRLGSTMGRNALFIANLSTEDQIVMITAYHNLIESVMAIGQVEHTNDWDPTISIELIPGKRLAMEQFNNAVGNLDEYFNQEPETFESGTGYPEFDLHLDHETPHITVYNQDPDDDYEFTTNIPIHMIHCIWFNG